MKEYSSSNIPLAKHLRREMTPWERKLWYMFLKTYPVRFQRQKAIGSYIADFYAAKARLVLELDGSGHYEEVQMIRDAKRTADLEKLGITVLRISNRDVDRDFRGVCEQIDHAVNQAERLVPFDWKHSV